MSRICSFFGHRELRETAKLKEQLYAVIVKLIEEESVDTFLFGSKSRFDGICHETVTALKEKYPHVRRIYVRAEYPIIGEQYEAYLSAYFEETYYPETVFGLSRYVERNTEMIRRSDFCVFYYDPQNLPVGRKSGTKIALENARRMKKNVIVLNP